MWLLSTILAPSCESVFQNNKKAFEEEIFIWVHFTTHFSTMKRKHTRGDPNASFLFAKKGNEYVVLLFFCFYFLWPHHVACGILVSWPGVKLELWQWKPRVLTSGLPGNFLNVFIFKVITLGKKSLYIVFWY